MEKVRRNGIHITHSAGSLDKRRSVSHVITCEEPASQTAVSDMQREHEGVSI